MKFLPIFFSIAAIFIFNQCIAQTQEQQPIQIKLYAIDCGRIGVANSAGFSDTGDYDNKSMQFADPCFLIIHPKGTLLWDTGLSDSLIKKPETVGGIYHLTKLVSLQDSLKEIGLTPSDIKYVTVSHSHFDHMSGLNQFPNATWILQKTELNYAKTHPNPFVIDASQLKSWKTAHALPDLKIRHIKAKIDTGAKTSTLHAFELERFKKTGKDWLKFKVHPLQRRLDKTVKCSAELLDVRSVTNSGGNTEDRYIIMTTLAINELTWPIELTLTNRDVMKFRMLLGRTALRDRYLVDLRKSYLTKK